jgi:protein phosphatase
VTVFALPADALVLLIGAAGSGKSTLAARLFAPDEILSSDAFRAAVSGDAADQSATGEAFRRLDAELERRMAAGRFTVVDATNVKSWARRRLLAAAGRHRRPTAGIVMAIPLEVSLDRNARRTDGRVPATVVRRHDADLRRSLASLATEGFDALVVLEGSEDVSELEVDRTPGTKRPGPGVRAS